MALVDDEHNVPMRKMIEFRLRHTALAGFDVAHLLDGGDDERILRVDAGQFRSEHARVLGTLHIILVVGERSVFPQ